MNKSAIDYGIFWLCGVIVGMVLGGILLSALSRFGNATLYLHKLRMWNHKPLADDLVFLVNYGKRIKGKGNTHS
jgi:hypothetical protein